MDIFIQFAKPVILCVFIQTLLLASTTMNSEIKGVKDDDGTGPVSYIYISMYVLL